MEKLSRNNIIKAKFKDKSPSLYDPTDIQQIIEYYIPILYRILKNNQHFSKFIQAIDKSQELNKDRNNLFPILSKYITSIIHKSNGTISYTTWSIHTDIEWGRGWQDEFDYNEINMTTIKSYRFVIVMAFGMLLNTIAHDCFKRGVFYSDYIEFKNYIFK